MFCISISFIFFDRYFVVLLNFLLIFLWYIFKTKHFLSQAETICEGSGKRYVISLRKFREELTIKFPTDVKEQKVISKILWDMDKEIENLEKEREKYKQIKIGMMQQLLTGRIRLKCQN